MYTMKEVCEKTGLHYETLKFYCNQGLIPDVQRDGRNRRIFDEHHISWIHGLLCLKRCGMGIPEMKEYLSILLSDDPDISKLKEILARKRQGLLEAREEIQSSIAYIDWKHRYYDDVLAGKEMLYHQRKVAKTAEITEKAGREAG
ncbi:MAG: MerR family transcriptional regulator [Candidatus Onthomonas sp.]